MKKIVLFLALALCAASVACAAEGKVKSVNGDKVIAEMSDTAKLKKGGSVKINGKSGKITSLEGNTITIKCGKAAELKAGDAVKVDKVNDMQGC